MKQQPFQCDDVPGFNTGVSLKAEYCNVCVFLPRWDEGKWCGRLPFRLSAAAQSVLRREQTRSKSRAFPCVHAIPEIVMLRDHRDIYNRIPENNTRGSQYTRLKCKCPTPCVTPEIADATNWTNIRNLCLNVINKPIRQRKIS